MAWRYLWMIARLPTPWFDPIVCALSQYDEEFRNHYLKTISNQKQNFVCCDNMNQRIIHRHHIIPINDLGSNSASNLIDLCNVCHPKAENGLLQLPMGGTYYGRGIKKKNKLLRKWYNDIDYSIGRIPSELFIRKHFSINSAIKELINLNQLDKLKELSVVWYNEKIIKVSL